MAKRITDKQRKNREINPRSLENLKPFQKGESGNPAGRPKSTTLSEALRVELARLNPKAKDEQTYAETIAKLMVKAAATGKGSIRAAQEIADRTEGKPRQSVDMDMNVRDWRTLARSHGIDEQDVIREAQRIISESDFTGSDHQAH
jgi:hypothetical protein